VTGSTSLMREFVSHGINQLSIDDPILAGLLDKEIERQANTLNLVASSSLVEASVQVCQASPLVNVTAEGYPGKRYQGGCRIADEVEALAIERAKQAFGASFANVQPHSASVANELILLHFVPPGGTILGMSIDAGGHLTHGSPASVSGRVYNAIGYGVGPDGLIDYDQVCDLALKHRPQLIICGTTAYPRRLDFARFRQIADQVGALLLADITHIAGLVATGLHESPLPHAHIVTTCTHKQLYGPRGGLILLGPAADEIRPGSKMPIKEEIQRAVFPFFQGAPILNAIAAKAHAFQRVLQPGFRLLTERIKHNASQLAQAMMELGYAVISKGTDNHIVVCDVRSNQPQMTGIIAQKALERCNIAINKNVIPNDPRSPFVTSGIRLGSNSIALRHFEPADIVESAQLIDKVLRSVTLGSGQDFEIPASVEHAVIGHVRELCIRRPVRDIVGLGLAA
jgi:glycine hydroxymethyltransferase